uniref:Dissimilatory sulfite reductase (Desulfoviridin), alpha/beta subunit n=1 Tax=Desulfovibrio sp. U5L TaxID=596152 RepID=I2Q6P9_9BACT
MPTRPYVLETCRGVKPSGCPRALALPEAFMAALAALADAAPVPPGLAGLGRELRHHEVFRLALCACPNGCARPQVADLGLTAAVRPVVVPEACTGCGACADACPDGAVTFADGVAAIDRDRCLGCGKCRDACPAGAIACGQTALRAMAGGRLGRRPRLGIEPAGRFTPERALALAGRCLTAYGQAARPGLRFGDIAFPDGLPGFPGWMRP